MRISQAGKRNWKCSGQVLKPFAVFDEIDTGLDVDALGWWKK
jgi:Fe-S cluster assembly ATPase SufC